jgi:hypothetical protein
MQKTRYLYGSGFFVKACVLEAPCLRSPWYKLALRFHVHLQRLPQALLAYWLLKALLILTF